MKKTILFTAIIVLLFSSCEREATVKVPEHQQKLVIHGQQAQNRLFAVRVGRSLSITEPVNYQNTQQFDVMDALVLLKQNDAVVDTLKYNLNSKRYEGRKHRSLLGNRYVIDVSAPTFTRAEGNSTFPDLVQPVRVSLERRARASQGSGYLDKITITFNDNVIKTNHYLFRIRRAEGSFASCITTNDKDVERLVYSDPFSSDECLGGNRLLVSDKNLNGATKTIVFYVENYQMNEIIQQGRKIKPTIELLSINEDFFRYIKSVNAYDNAIDNPFAEPVNIVSNIKNGYGFFTTFAMAIDTVR